ncbi:MAG: ABC transporter permease [Phycisphaeraceae bacterium]
MRKYLHILRLFWGTSLAAEMEYRANFAISALTSLGNLVGSIFLFHLLFQQSSTIQGWTFHEALLVMGFFTLLEGFANTVLRVNLSRIVRHVQQGTLDFVLLKPIDSQFWLSTRNFSLWGLPDVAYGLVLIGYAGSTLGLGVVDYVSAVVPLLLGVVVLYGIWFILGSTSIWFVKIQNVTYVLKNLLNAGKFPAAIYPTALRFVFTFVVPVAFLTTVPAEVMLGRSGWWWIVGAVAFAVGMFSASRWFWRFALRYYTSASS